MFLGVFLSVRAGNVQLKGPSLDALTGNNLLALSPTPHNVNKIGVPWLNGESSGKLTSIAKTPRKQNKSQIPDWTHGT